MRSLSLVRRVLAVLLSLPAQAQLVAAEAAQLSSGAAAGTMQVLLARELHHAAWSAEHGAPGAVRGVVQTPDGFLWLGTDTGLYRFDGVRFERIESLAGQRLKSNDISALAAAPDGRVAIGYRLGGLSLHHDGKLTHYAAARDVPHGSPTQFLFDSNGDLWAGFTGGFARLRAGRWETVPEVKSVMFSSGLVQEKDGTLWVAHSEGIHVLRSGHPGWVHLRGDIEAFASITVSPTGGIWLTKSDGHHFGPIRVEGDAVLPDPRIRPVELPEGGVMSGMFSSDGALWLSTLSGVLQCVPKGGGAMSCATFGAKNGLSGDTTFRFFEDREGNVWVGSANGVDRFRRPGLRHVDLLGDNALAAIAPKVGGGVWVNTYRTGLRSIDEPSRKILQGLGAAVLRRDASGTLWVGGEQQLWRLSEAGEPQRVDWPQEIAKQQVKRVRAIAVSRSGDVWMSVGVNPVSGLYRLRRGTWSLQTLLPGPPLGAPFSMEPDSEGGMWLGYGSGRVLRVAADRVDISLSEGDAGQVGAVLSIMPMGRRAILGGEFGVAFFDGQRVQALKVQGEGLRGVGGIVQTLAGDLWLSCSLGLVHIDREEWQRALAQPGHAMSYRLFDHRNGLKGVPHQLNPLPALVQSDDGKLWVATSAGIAYLDPAHLLRNPVRPLVVVRGVNSTEGFKPAAEEIRLAPGGADLRVDYTAASLSIPERVSFRYILEGYDSAWHDVRDQRSATYTGVPPGSYTFRVSASNEDGLWSEGVATQRIEIPPAYWQTAWFKVLLGLAAACLLAALNAWMSRQREAQLRARIEGRVAERVRISQDMHDTFLQSTVALTLQMQAALEEIPPGLPARERLERALSRADDVMAEGRDLLRVLRPARQEKSLAERLEATVHELQETVGGPAFRVQCPVGPELRPEVAEDVYRAAREAIINAVRHASARWVDVGMGHDPDGLWVRVRDDGEGFAPDAGQKQFDGHVGLSAMRERIESHGGEVIVATGKNGTEVAISVPMQRAYLPVRPKRRPWPWRLTSKAGVN